MKRIEKFEIATNSRLSTQEGFALNSEFFCLFVSFVNCPKLKIIKRVIHKRIKYDESA